MFGTFQDLRSDQKQCTVLLTSHSFSMLSNISSFTSSAFKTRLRQALIGWTKSLSGSKDLAGSQVLVAWGIMTCALSSQRGRFTTPLSLLSVIFILLSSLLVFSSSMTTSAGFMDP